MALLALSGGTVAAIPLLSLLALGGLASRFPPVGSGLAQSGEFAYNAVVVAMYTGAAIGDHVAGGIGSTVLGLITLVAAGSVVYLLPLALVMALTIVGSP